MAKSRKLAGTEFQLRRTWFANKRWNTSAVTVRVPGIQDSGTILNGVRSDEWCRKMIAAGWCLSLESITLVPME